ncbi:MAG TPA: hypothetical protein VL742_06655 [Casimicrobiaceae bacterium]|nr:hypothetical protein [Casimicrobiaceae bacterium]
MKRLRLDAHVALAAGLLAAAAPLAAQPATAGDGWTWWATIYAWGPSISGTSNFKGLPGG